MAASGTKASRPGGFSKLYMFVWAIAAAAALAYLASLMTNPDLAKSFQQQAQGEQEQGLRLASRALSEVGAMRRAMGDVQRDLGQVKESLEQREANDKSVQAKLAQLEEKVAALTPQSGPVAQTTTQEKAPKQKAAEKAKTKAGERATSRLSRLEGEEQEPGTPRVETGSLPGEGEESAQTAQQQAQAAQQPAAKSGQSTITFGTPTVISTSKSKSTTYAIQVAAANSLETLRTNWIQLVAKHGDALGALQPRYVAPRNEGGKYRLVAGPFNSKADAEKACTDLGVGRTGCFSTSFAGDPL